jgi:hypothetical protein
MGTSPEQQVRTPRPELDRYPPVALRSDLVEVQSKNEKELVIASVRAVEDVIQVRRAKDSDNVGRGDHAKPLGCYSAEFTVSAGDVVRVEDQAGIARRENLGKRFGAVVRFSNSEPKDVSDYLSATVGLAVKVRLDSANYSNDEFLVDRSGEQDFVAGGLKVFVSKDVADYSDLLALRIHPYANALAIAGRHPQAFDVFAVEPFLRLFRPTSSAAPLVLGTPFSSLLPYAWGDSAVKFRFEPCPETQKVFEKRKVSVSRFDESYQSRVVADFLKSNELCYVMKIQTRPRAGSDEEKRLIEKTFPIEDATVYWPEPGQAHGTLSAEFREVARVTIKPGETALPDLDCECLAFNPWNGLKAHQPLGSLNRARWAVYNGSESVRKEVYKDMTRRCPSSVDR